MKRRTDFGPKLQQFTVKEVCDALARCRGYVSKAARVLGCSQSTVRRYCERYSECREVLDEARCHQLDEAELALAAAVQEKQGWAVCFTLKTLGRGRGYIENQRIEHALPDGQVYGVLVVPAVVAPEQWADVIAGVEKVQRDDLQA